MTPGDRIKQAATVMAQITINGVLYNRYNIDAGAAATGMRTFRDGLGQSSTVDAIIHEGRTVPVLIENGSAWVTAVGIVRRGGSGELDMLTDANDANLYGSSAGTPPGGFTSPAAVITVSNTVTISVVDSVSMVSAMQVAKKLANYGNAGSKLAPIGSATFTADELRQHGMASVFHFVELGILAIGNNAKAHGKDSISIGSGNVQSKYSIMLGFSSYTDKPNTTVLGYGIECFSANSFAHGCQRGSIDVNGTATSGVQTVEIVQMQSRTTNATPVNLFCYESDTNDNVDTYYPNSDKFPVWSGLVVFNCEIVAHNVDTNEMKVWNYKFYVKNTNAYGAAATFGTPVKTVIASDANTASWDVGFTIDQPNDELTIQCTGAAAKDVLWTATVEVKYINSDF